jgi:predicted deacylase
MYRLIFLLALLTVAVPPANSAEEWDAIELLGRAVPVGSKSRFAFIPDRSFEASYLNTPVFVARGAAPGPTLCVTAGVHGDELNGVEVARRAFGRVDPRTLRGTLITLPAINAQGVRTENRYLSDRRDLNRAFPGREQGSVSSLIASAVFDVIRRCDALVDLHTASQSRTNLPQIRADISDPEIRALAVHFGLGIVVAGKGPEGSLRRATTEAGIPAIIYEAGAPYLFQEDEVLRGVEGVENVMAYLEMIDQEGAEIPDTRVYEKTRWIRAKTGQSGFFFPSAELGELIEPGQRLGQIIDPFTDESFDVMATIPGEIIGMALPHPVLSGYALFHVAWHEGD